jgi:hypothetical protein
MTITTIIKRMLVLLILMGVSLSAEWEILDSRKEGIDWSRVQHNKHNNLMLNPREGTEVLSPNVYFKWRDIGASKYILLENIDEIGMVVLYKGKNTETKGIDIYEKEFVDIEERNSYARIYNLNDSKMLLSYKRGVWYLDSFTYQYPITIGGLRSRMESPVKDSTLDSTRVVFSWENRSEVSQYWLQIGTQENAYDLYNGSQGNNSEKIISNLPQDGSTIHVSLYSQIQGRWYKVSYRYKAYTSLNSLKSKITYPIQSKNRISIINQEFIWTDSDADLYHLSIGTKRGSGNLYSQSQGRNTSKIVRNLPASTTIFVRLWTKFNKRWFYNDYSYITESKKKSSLSLWGR